MIYMLRRVTRNEVEIAKFEDHDIPEDTYRFNTQTFQCNCPSPQMPCKHLDLVRAWEGAGGMLLDGRWVPNPILETADMERLLRRR